MTEGLLVSEHYKIDRRWARITDWVPGYVGITKGKAGITEEEGQG